MSRPTLVIGNRNYSSWSLRGWLVLAHAGIDFDLVRIPLFTPGYQDAIARYSPSRIVAACLTKRDASWGMFTNARKGHHPINDVFDTTSTLTVSQKYTEGFMFPVLNEADSIRDETSPNGVLPNTQCFSF